MFQTTVSDNEFLFYCVTIFLIPDHYIYCTAIREKIFMNI